MLKTASSWVPPAETELKLWTSLKNGSRQGLRSLSFIVHRSSFILAPPSPVCVYLLRKRNPFLRQMGAHPRKLLRAGKACSGTAFPRYDLPLNSFTSADHLAPQTPIKNEQKREKENKENLGVKRDFFLVCCVKRGEKEKRLRLTCTLL